MNILTTEQDLRRYEEWVLTHPHGSLWQSLERKRYAEACGKETRLYASGKWKVESGKYEATALVIIDRTTGGFSNWEIPRGPLWVSEEAAKALMQQIIDDAKAHQCMALYLSPISPLSTFHFPLSTRRIHAEATRILDLTKTENELLAQMHPKGRYNIGVAQKHGVEVKQGTVSDVEAFYGLLQSTGNRDGFVVSQKSHYTRFLTHLERSFILMATHEGKAVAGLIGVMWPPPSPLAPLPTGEGNVSHQRNGIYYYGASSYEHRQLMAPYLLQWEAMKHCRQNGCSRYDLLGVAATDSPEDPWTGISDFKRKFGGTVVTHPPEQMIVLRPVMKKVLEWKRKVLG